jgi:cation transport ATPase
MRLRVHGGKGHPHLLARVKESVSRQEGVTHVHANPDTGSLVVHYRHKKPREFAQQLAEHGENSGVFQIPDVGQAGELWSAIEKEANFLAAHSALARSIVEETKHLDNEVKRATDNALDLKVLVPLGLAAVSFLYVGTDISTPLWVSLGLFSFNSFLSLHPPYPYPKTEDQTVPNT